MGNKRANVIVKVVAGIIVLGLICIIGARYLNKTRPFYFKISSGSMEPTILKDERVFINRFAYTKEKPQRGDIIVYKKLGESFKLWMHRIVGLPGEKIEIKNGEVYINDKIVAFPTNDKQIYYYNRGDFGEGVSRTIPEKMYFVLGDNSSESADSRYLGFLPEENIVGKAVLIISKDKQAREVR